MVDDYTAITKRGIVCFKSSISTVLHGAAIFGDTWMSFYEHFMSADKKMFIRGIPFEFKFHQGIKTEIKRRLDISQAN